MKYFIFFQLWHMNNMQPFIRAWILILFRMFFCFFCNYLEFFHFWFPCHILVRRFRELPIYWCILLIIFCGWRGLIIFIHLCILFCHLRCTSLPVIEPATFWFLLALFNCETKFSNLYLKHSPRFIKLIRYRRQSVFLKCGVTFDGSTFGYF